MRPTILVAAVSLQGCIFVPQTTAQYDEECRTHTKQMTLRPEQIGTIGHCIGRECAAALVVIGAVAAASVIVSGSVVVVGNVVYWLEKQGQCAI